MPRVKKNQPWRYEAGRGETHVVAFERIGEGRKPGSVVMRYTDSRKTGRDKRSSATLPFLIRDEYGSLDADAVRRAEDEVEALATQLRCGDPVDIRPSSEKALTIFDGFTLVADPIEGAHLGKKGHIRRKRLLASRDTLAHRDIFGPNKTFKSLEAKDIEKVWRKRAHQYLESGRGGHRSTEILIADLFAVANWLRKRYPKKVGVADARAPQKWRKDMLKDWERTTEKKVHVTRGRHTDEEMKKIFANLYDDHVDPRLALAIELGAELRIGQVLRLRRSQVVLESDPDGFAPHGRFVVEGEGNKGGAPVAMLPEQRLALDRALETFLRVCEASYQAKAIADYYIFPSRIRMDGTAYPHNADDYHPVGRQQMLRDFHELERISGVEVIERRGWYGLRRLIADLASDNETDARVLNAYQGWAAGSTVRESTYHLRDSLKIAGKGAELRAKVRAPKAKDGPGKSPE